MRPIVWENLFRLRDRVLSSVLPASSREGLYSALLHIETGEVRFPRNLEILAQDFPKFSRENVALWEEVVFRVHVSEEGTILHIEKVGESLPISSVAKEVILDMMQMVNAAGRGVVDPSVLFQRLLREKKEGDSLERHPSWQGNIDRIEMEKRLQGRTIGTFAVRQAEEIDRLIALALGQANGERVEVYVLAIVEPSHKVIERLLLRTKKGWILYADEPNLSLYRWASSFSEIVQGLPRLLHFPLAS